MWYHDVMAEHAGETVEKDRPLSLYMRAIERTESSPLKQLLKEREESEKPNASPNP